jgi:hypothetical protein
MRRLGVLLLVGALAACGGDDDDDDGGGTTSVTTGGIGTGPVTNATAVRASGTCDYDTGTVAGVIPVYASTAVAALSTVADACGKLQAGTDPANATGVLVTVIKAGTSPSTTLTTGDYPVTTDPLIDVASQTATYAIVSVGQSGAPVLGETTCPTTASAKGASGTVTITRVTASEIEGRLNVTLDNAQTVTGTFRAPTCALTTGIDQATCTITGIPELTTCG